MAEPGLGTWSPYLWVYDCGAGVADCSCGGGSWQVICHFYQGCSPSDRCYQEDEQRIYCCQEGSDYTCKVRWRNWPCGECTWC